jgi:formylglycine-generating enzyme required for sulfatase activity
MVWVPATSFMMGRSRGDEVDVPAEQPPHAVHVPGFWLDRTEVTNHAYRQCVEAQACRPPQRTEAFDDPELADHPVIWIDWFQARGYCRWADKRLPSEAEWELAARSGTVSRFPWGEVWHESRGNGHGSTAPDLWPETAPVGSFPANALGLVDMLGNAWEWVADAYHPDYGGAPTDGRPWTQLSGGGDLPGRVLRGGSFASFMAKLRVSHRERRPESEPSRATGFRCAADDDGGPSG